MSAVVSRPTRNVLSGSKCAVCYVLSLNSTWVHFISIFIRAVFDGGCEKGSEAELRRVLSSEQNVVNIMLMMKLQHLASIEQSVNWG